MEDIIQSITEAEARAAEIKAQADVKASEIVANAEKEALEISKRNEAECKSLREREIWNADVAAEKDYAAALDKKRAECAASSAAALKNAKNAALEVVRRITRGCC